MSHHLYNKPQTATTNDLTTILTELRQLWDGGGVSVGRAGRVFLDWWEDLNVVGVLRTTVAGPPVKLT